MSISSQRLLPELKRLKQKFAAAILIACPILVSPMLVSAESILIRNTTIDTMTSQGQLQGTDILIVDGKIARIGENLASGSAKVINGKGKRVTPGVFNAYTQLGLVEVGAIEQTRDFSMEGEPGSVGLKAIDGFNPNSTLIPQNRIHGVTQALVVPEASDSLFGGKVSVVNLTSSMTGSVEKEAVGVLVNYNEFSQKHSGGARAAALATIRNAIEDAKEFSRNRTKYNNGEGRELSLGLADLKALQPVINRQEYLVVKVDRASDILKVLELGQELRVRLILVGATEGWMVANNIAAANAPVIIDPIKNLPSQFQTLGSRLENAAMLHKAGVTLLFTGMGWQNTHNAYLVTQSAGNAVANGLPYQAALEAIFTNPAKVFNLKTNGQIKVGAVADLVLWNNDPLEVVKEAELVMVKGLKVPMVSRSTRLRDRYFEKVKQANAKAAAMEQAATKNESE